MDRYNRTSFSVRSVSKEDWWNRMSINAVIEHTIDEPYSQFS